MNVIRMQIYQISTVLSEQNDFFNSAIQLQNRNERKKKTKRQYKSCVKIAVENWNLPV